MNKIFLSSLLGIVMAAPVIMWLHPLNTGAVGLIMFIAIGLGGLIIGAVSKKRGKQESQVDEEEK